MVVLYSADCTLYHVELVSRALGRSATAGNKWPQTLPCFPLLRDCRSHGSNLQSAMAREQKLKKRPKASSTSLKESRRAAAKQAARKMSKGPKLISSSQAADLTASINSQFAQVKSSCAQVGCDYYHLARMFTNSSLVLFLPEKPAHSCLRDCCPKPRQRHQQAVASSKNMCVSFVLVCTRIIC